MPDPDEYYRAYLLRLWRTGDSDQSEWRASLERPGTGERHVFGHLQALFAFLEGTTEEARDAAAPAPGSHPLVRCLSAPPGDPDAIEGEST